jgi:hypothetical protein
LGLVTIGSLIIIVDQIKEIIMKKIIFWTALISVLGLLIGACAKRDDNTAVTKWTVSCEDTTASGSITIGSDTASGTYLVQTWNDAYLSRPATGCNATTEHHGSPTGTQSVLQKRIVTSSTSFLDHVSYYSDTACTSRLGYIDKKYSNLSVGEQVSGLDSSSGRPTSGYRVTYNEDCAKIMGDTDAVAAALNNSWSSELKLELLTTGTEKVFGFGENSVYNKHYSIWGAGDNGTTYSFYSARGGSAGYEPSDWDANSGANTYQR